MDADPPSITICPATANDSGAVAEIWHDGHDGRFPPELAEVWTEESFHVRAAQRVGDTTVAVVSGNAQARVFYKRAGWRDEGPFDDAAATDDGPVAVPCHRYTMRV